MTAKETQMAGFICPFVQSKTIIQFYYVDSSNDNSDWRIVEPHLIGILKTTGNAALAAWFLPTQVQLQNGETQGWRLYLLDNISTVSSSNRHYTRTRPGYNPNDSRMSRIICRTALTR
jgi:hypothetical protein